MWSTDSFPMLRNVTHERFGGIDIEACFQPSTVDEQDVHAAAQAVRLFPWAQP